MGEYWGWGYYNFFRVEGFLNFEFRADNVEDFFKVCDNERKK